MTAWRLGGCGPEPENVGRNSTVRVRWMLGLVSAHDRRYNGLRSGVLWQRSPGYKEQSTRARAQVAGSSASLRTTMASERRKESEGPRCQRGAKVDIRGSQNEP